MVGAIAAALWGDLPAYILDYLRLLCFKAHNHHPLPSPLDDTDAVVELPLFLFIDGKQGVIGEFFPILLHFPLAHRPGSHIAWLPIGMVHCPAGSVASWRRVLVEKGLGPALGALQGMRLTRNIIIRLRFLGDYAIIRVLLNTHRSNIPFPHS